jgi:putative membrane-bound dehydrogenase-like protein
LLAATLVLTWSALAVADDGAPQTGPATEKRFPPLKVPAGFKATLFACDPVAEYPSAVAAGPRSGSVFVAMDYMSGLGVEIVRRDEVRLLEDTDGDGYADKSSVFAKGFNSIQGLERTGDTVFVMHAPFLSVVRDRDGDGVADERRDLLSGLGLPPEENPPRLHCANGVVAAHDGWLYLALGDHGCDVPRPEGDRLVLHGGGILRCRPNGRDLHVFATGLRNIYDVALDEDLNVFVRDNENDGGDYMIRVAHSFFGADHGYPYLYLEHPKEALAPLANLGRGSSAGGVCYLETAFSPEYRGDLFFCEWGRAVMRSHPVQAGSAFAPLKEIEFAAGAPDDSYGFKPTDIAVQRDGSLIVTDWADGQRPKRGRGRIYRIAPAEGSKPPQGMKPHEAALGAWIARLDSESSWERDDAQDAIEGKGHAGTLAVRAAIRDGRLGVRGRLHAAWILAHNEGRAAIPELIDLLRTDAEPRVQAQAVRAVADLADPVVLHHRLDTGPRDPDLASQMAALAQGKDARVVREVVIALGRLRWSDSPAWLASALPEPDPALAHAAMQTLRRSSNWKAVLKLLDGPDSTPLRAIALRALADCYELDVVDGLISRLRDEPDPKHRQEYADLLVRTGKRAGPWTYWGYRPAPRPANTVRWERSDAIVQALDRVLADPDREVRLAVLRRMNREQIATRLPTLESWLRSEHDPGAVAAILDSMRGHPAGQTRRLLEALLSDRTHTTANRKAALDLWAGGLDDASERRLLEVAGSLEEGPVLAAVLRTIGARPKLPSSSLLIDKLSSRDPELRAAAVEALTALRGTSAGEAVRGLLSDPDSSVRRAAAAAMGRLGVRSASASLLTLARGTDPALRRVSLDSMRLLREPGVLPLAVAGLDDRETQQAALRCLEELGGPDHVNEVGAMATRNPPTEVLQQVVRLLDNWSHREGLPVAQQADLARALAEVQGASGMLAHWHVSGPLGEGDISTLVERIGLPSNPLESPGGNPSGWTTQVAGGSDSRLRLRASPHRSGEAWLACTDLDVPAATSVQFLASASGQFRFWLNGRLVYQRQESRSVELDSDRFDVVLDRGRNRVIIAVRSSSGAVELQVRFRRKGSTSERERLMQLALTRTGNAERGRAIFLNTAASQCLKCHPFRDQGGRIGPDLTTIGSRFPRAYLIESVLEPSRAIAPSFETLTVALGDGRVVSGVRTSETETSLTLGDQEGKAHVVLKADIEARRVQPLSLMPEGLEKQLTPDEFVDLIAFLAGQK